MDAETNIHGLSDMKELAETLEKLGYLHTVQFEDNLSSHKTAAVEQAWKQYLPSRLQSLYPSNLAWCLQVIDRHIGKQPRVTI